MKRTLFSIICLCAPVFAGPITPSGWYGFGWNGIAFPISTVGLATGSVFTPITDPGASPWTFTLASPTNLMVVDGFESGDVFEIFDFGSSIGTTSPSASGTSGCAGGDDPITCLADLNFSSGVFLLGPGSYSIEISVISGATSGGAWFGFEDSAVPEPGTLSLGVLAGLGLFAVRRRVTHQ